MDAELTVTGSADPRGELVLLRKWLNREDDYRGRVDFKPAEPQEGELGFATDVLLAGIAAGGLDALGRTVAVWIQSRRSEIEVEVSAPDGTRVRITAKGPVAKSVAKRLDPGA
ncbi:hypothetical protein [Glycomyces sp. NPDC047010]|uniref:effector-associated constant component EACC1 n=1 Tax=Glycomyces sp. NPDC047010 TaxID=3155023 RepID=UPI0033FE22F5